MLSQSAVLEIVKDLYPKWESEKDDLTRIDRWYRWEHDKIELPKKATPELRNLAELSKTPWLGLVVSTVSQGMRVDGYKSSNGNEEAEDSGPWRTWLANGWDRRQIAVHRGALAYGYAYGIALPGTDDFGAPQSVLRALSPKKLYAVYADPAEDDWPIYGIEVHAAPGGKALVRLYDEEHIYFVECDGSGGEPKYIEDRYHGAMVCPIVRYAMPDLDGRCVGRVEPFIPLAARINKTSYDRLLTQHFNSWKIRYATGMAEPKDEAESKKLALVLRQQDLLIGEDPDTRFGTLDETSLGGFIDAWKSDIEALAAVSQTPTHALTGQLVNLSGDALAAARAGLTQTTAEWQWSLGSSHNRLLRLGAALEGNVADARDVRGRVTWQDMEVRSISQAADALGKVATMLQVPVEALWSRIPGVEKSDVDDWKKMAENADPIVKLNEQLSRQADDGED